MSIICLENFKKYIILYYIFSSHHILNIFPVLSKVLFGRAIIRGKVKSFFFERIEIKLIFYKS